MINVRSQLLQSVFVLCSLYHIIIDCAGCIGPNHPIDAEFVLVGCGTIVCIAAAANAPASFATAYTSVHVIVVAELVCAPRCIRRRLACGSFVAIGVIDGIDGGGSSGDEERPLELRRASKSKCDIDVSEDVGDVGDAALRSPRRLVKREDEDDEGKAMLECG